MDNKVKPRISAVITDFLKCPHSQRYDASKNSLGRCLYAKKKAK